MDRRRSNDRLSDLPDGVIHRILSLLPIDAAVRTSVLSSRWRHLWSTNPSLHFPSFTDLDADITFNNYADGVDSCLRLCASTDHFTSLSFTIHERDTIEQTQLMAKRWLEFASTRLVDSLSLTYEYPDYYFPDELSALLPFPETLFCCWTIKTLKLDHCTLYEIPAEYGHPVFPFLEKFFLKSVAFVADDLSGFISACPKLKTLNIACSWFLDGDHVIVISSPTLETLDVYRKVRYYPCLVDIRSAPRLRFLGLCCDLTVCKTVPLVNIEEVALINDVGKKFHDRTQWRRLVLAVRNARVLRVDEWFTQFELNGDSNSNSRLPVFGNLKRLDFYARPNGFMWVYWLVYNMSECPVLEELYLKMNCMWTRNHTATDDLNHDGCDDVISAGILRKLKKDVLVVPPLKSVIVDDFKGETAMTAVLQFLLYKSSLLELVVLYHRKCFVNIKMEVANALEKMLSSPKASPSVKITAIDSSNFSYASVPENILGH